MRKLLFLTFLVALEQHGFATPKAQVDRARISVYCPFSSEHNCSMFCELDELPESYSLRVRFRDTPGKVGWRSRSLSIDAGRKVFKQLQLFVISPTIGADNSGVVVLGSCEFNDGRSVKLKFRDAEILGLNPVLCDLLNKMMSRDLAIPHWAIAEMPFLFHTSSASPSTFYSPNQKPDFYYPAK